MRISALGFWLLVTGVAHAQVRDSVVAIDEVVVRTEAPDAVVQARSATLTTSIGRGETKRKKDDQNHNKQKNQPKGK